MKHNTKSLTFDEALDVVKCQAVLDYILSLGWQDTDNKYVKEVIADADSCAADIEKLTGKSTKDYLRDGGSEQAILQWVSETKSVKAVKYMLSVWDEVLPDNWRNTPDHVQKKFLEAEAEQREILRREGLK